MKQTLGSYFTYRSYKCHITRIFPPKLCISSLFHLTNFKKVPNRTYDNRVSTYNRNLRVHTYDSMFQQCNVHVDQDKHYETEIILNSNLMIPDFPHIIKKRLAPIKFLYVTFESGIIKFDFKTTLVSQRQTCGYQFIQQPL